MKLVHRSASPKPPWKGLRYYFGVLLREVGASAQELAEALIAYPKLLMRLLTSLPSRSTEAKRRILLLELAFSLFLHLGLAQYVGLKAAGAMELMCSIMVPMLLLQMLIFLFTHTVNGYPFFSFAMVFLINVGEALQILLKYPLREGQTASANSFAFIAWLSLAAALLSIPLMYIFLYRISRRTAVRVLFAAVVTCYLVLVLFGHSVGGARAWLIIGSLSFQLTEVAKLLTTIAFGLIFSDSTQSEGGRLKQATVLMAINTLFLFFCSELGTLMVLGFTFIVTAVLFIPSTRLLLRGFLISTVLVGSILLVCTMCHKAAETHTGAASLPKAVLVGDKIYQKVSLRVRLAYDLDSVIEDDQKFDQSNSYQSKTARDALMAAVWAGDGLYHQNVPVQESDFVFVFLTQRMGVLFSTIVLIVFFLMYVLTGKQCGENPAELAVMGSSLLSAVVIQCLISCASAAGIFPLVGVGVAFLSKGNAHSIVSYTMCILILWCSRETAWSDEWSEQQEVPHEA